ncbi:hypothetical protein GLP37_21775 [Photobacterium phosphoreum]|uniref:hypothetical protein n=1 Tax=Photobacterium phosphoreum TaxID=659 RepID=UPI001E49F73F|nr:hypothetical protein [Photobacterium phosphoreum]MCD9504796.1 hypothetical protein [Photobacterium phosphoreum]
MEIEITKVTYTAHGKEYSCELENLTEDRVNKLVLIDYQRKEKPLLRDSPWGLEGVELDNYQLESYGITIKTVETIK